jgi:RimJ/RimL family protein N-acetyltransferase
VFQRCRKTGLHLVRTPRLWIVSGRICDLPAWASVCSDPAAQQWLGWTDDMLHRVVVGRAIMPLRQRSGILRPNLDQLFFAAIDRATMLVVAGLSINRGAGGRLEVGGAVAAHCRGQGVGTETLTAVCALAHRHFGIGDLHAGCEVSNVASIRWLRSSGFTPADGPARHVLPNGREIDSLWWSRRDPQARRRCPWISDQSDTR